MKVELINRASLAEEMVSARNKVKDVLDDIPSNAAICVYFARLEGKINELIAAHNVLVDRMPSPKPNKAKLKKLAHEIRKDMGDE